MKKYALVFAVYAFIHAFRAVCLFSYDMGFSYSNTTVFLPENPYTPQTSSTNKFELFTTVNFLKSYYLLSFSPSVYYTDDKIYPGLYGAKFMVFYNMFSFLLAKNNVYFGEGIIDNFLFPLSFVNADQAYSNSYYQYTNFWNTAFYCDLNKISVPLMFTTSVIADTESIDAYKKPQWLVLFAKADYSDKSLSASLCYSPIYKNDAWENRISGEVKYIFANDFNLYSNASYNFDKDIFALLGASKAFLVDEYTFATGLELSYPDNDMQYAIYEVIDYNYLSLVTGVYYVNNDTYNNRSITLMNTLSLTLNNLQISITWDSWNLLEKRSAYPAVLQIGVKYEKL